MQLEVTFLKSSEDHRLQLVRINGSIFAIVHSHLESSGPISLHCEDWSLVFLAPIKSEVDIVISGINIICFNEIESEKGTVNIHASNRLVKFASSIKSPQKVFERGDHGKFQFDDDPVAFLNYFKLFNNVVNSAHDGSQDSFFEAQQKFITSLCILAKKMEGKIVDLNIQKVLEIWDIPCSI